LTDSIFLDTAQTPYLIQRDLPWSNLFPATPGRPASVLASQTHRMTMRRSQWQEKATRNRAVSGHFKVSTDLSDGTPMAGCIAVPAPLRLGDERCG
jgi:hypothetical protein